MHGTRQLLSVQPNDVKFPFELKKHISCSLSLVNTTDNYIAFKVKTTSPKKYSVRPNTGLVSPRSTSNVILTMQAQWEAPPDMQCKDKFLVQSVIAPAGSTANDVPQEIFNKEAGHAVHEAKLKVSYVAPPSAEQGSSLETASAADHGDPQHRNQDRASKEVRESKAKLIEPTASAADHGDPQHRNEDMTSIEVTESKAKLIEPTAEQTTITAENNNVVVERLQQELANMVAQLDQRNHSSGTSQVFKQRRGYSFSFVLFIGIFGIVVGYFMSPQGRV